MTSCVFINCSNTSVNHGCVYSYHRLPLNEQVSRKWILNSGNLKLFDLEKQVLRNRYVCGKHFSACDYVNPQDRTKLNRNAVPANFQGPLEHQYESDDELILTKSPSVRTYANIFQKPKKDAIAEMEENLVDMTIGRILKSNNEGMNFVEETLGMPIEVKKKYTKKQYKDLRKVEKELLKYKRLFRNKVAQVKRLKKRNAELRSQNTLIAQLAQHEFATDTAAIIANMQIRTKKSEWLEDQKHLCIGIFYSIGASNYEKLRKAGIILPATITIHSWLAQTKYSPGFSPSFKNNLKEIAEKMTPEEKLCCVSFDEMSIMEALQYSVDLDQIEGFEDYGHLGRTADLARYALVFMARGLMKSYKFQMAYYLSRTGVKANKLVILLKYVLGQLIEAGFDPKIIVCDQATTNTSTFNSLGVSIEEPYFYIGEKKIIAIFDAPHLMKNIRTNMLTADFLYDNDNEKRISFNDIRTVYKLDVLSTKSRSLPRLTDTHMNPNQFEKMRVKLAVQVLSNSVYGALELCIRSGQIQSPTMENTAEFVKLMNFTWDALNSIGYLNVNVYNSAISDENPMVEEILLKAKDYFSKLKKCDHKSNKISKPPCFEGFQQTISGILTLFHDLSDTYESITYLPTRMLQQDCLENLFASFRQKGGCNRNPTARTFRYIFRSKANIYLIKSGNSNSEEDGSRIIHIGEKGDLSSTTINVTEPSTSKQPDEGLDESENAIIAHLMDMPFEDDLSTELEDFDSISLEKGAVEFFAGFIAGALCKKKPCNICQNLILTEESERHSGEVTNILIKNKQYDHIPAEKGLTFPSIEFSKMIDIALATFENVHKQVWYGSNVLKLCYEEIEKALNNNVLFNNLCQGHKEFMLKKMIRTKIYYTCKLFVNEYDELQKKAIAKRKELRTNKALKKKTAQDLKGKKNITKKAETSGKKTAAATKVNNLKKQLKDGQEKKRREKYEAKLKILKHK